MDISHMSMRGRTNSFLMDEMQFRISFWRFRSSSLAMRQSLCGGIAQCAIFFKINQFKLFWILARKYYEFWFRFLKDGKIQIEIDGFWGKITHWGIMSQLTRRANALSRAQIQFIDTWRVGKPTRKRRRRMKGVNYLMIRKEQEIGFDA